MNAVLYVIRAGTHFSLLSNKDPADTAGTSSKNRLLVMTITPIECPRSGLKYFYAL